MGCDLAEVGSAETCFVFVNSLVFFFFLFQVEFLKTIIPRCNCFFPRFSVFQSILCFYDFNILCCDFKMSVNMLQHLLASMIVTVMNLSSFSIFCFKIKHLSILCACICKEIKVLLKNHLTCFSFYMKSLGSLDMQGHYCRG